MKKIKNILVFFCIFGVFIFNNSYAKSYQIDDAKSKITFSAFHAGNQFIGEIKKYQSKIDFDQKNLKNSKIEVIFDMNSFKTGNDMYYETLPTNDWFDIKNHPEGYFKAIKIIKNSNNNFKMIGNLTIKNITKEINFDFNLKNITKNIVHAKSDFKINRLDFNIGRDSDDSGEWVDLKIDINLNLIAKLSE